MNNKQITDAEDLEVHKHYIVVRNQRCQVVKMSTRSQVQQQYSDDVVTKIYGKYRKLTKSKFSHKDWKYGYAGYTFDAWQWFPIDKNPNGKTDDDYVEQQVKLILQVCAL